MKSGDASSHSAYDALAGFGALYDAVPMYTARSDVPFYIEEAAHAKGRVLELGCGLGLVAVGATLAGGQVTATDYYDDASFFR